MPKLDKQDGSYFSKEPDDEMFREGWIVARQTVMGGDFDNIAIAHLYSEELADVLLAHLTGRENVKFKPGEWYGNQAARACPLFDGVES